MKIYKAIFLLKTTFFTVLFCEFYVICAARSNPVIKTKSTYHYSIGAFDLVTPTGFARTLAYARRHAGAVRQRTVLSHFPPVRIP